jgi:hypothetical protein
MQYGNGGTNRFQYDCFGCGPGQDYHWYRHDRGGMWSHKRGSLKVHNYDASGKPISDPRSADSNYGSEENYHDWGGYFAVPPNMIVGPNEN